MPALVVESPLGLYCPQGDFHIDPSGPVPRAVLTHVHADHAHPGAGEYLCAEPSVPLLRKRLSVETDAGAQSPLKVTGVRYGGRFPLGSATVSFHPSGHVLGSAQIRIEAGGEVWVVSGDYKRAPDPTCAPFEVVPCDVFITEATFALPIFRWDPAESVAADILHWWDNNRENDKASVLICYSLGKAQRLLAELQKLTDRPVYVHGAIELITQLYRNAGVQMLPTIPVVETKKGQSFKGELILAPRSARGQTWMRRFGSWEEAFVSGWMRIRGTRRHMSYDRGFVLSDHADWPALLQTIQDTGAKRVLCTHGYVDALSRYLSERGVDAGVLKTAFAGEGDIA
ncbi:MAG: ligase-associated DNA damage response exonuclease [Myxococcaceae bacterium]